MIVVMFCDGAPSTPHHHSFQTISIIYYAFYILNSLEIDGVLGVLAHKHHI